MNDWDFGRSLSGSRWEAPQAHAKVLLLHGYAEHVGRYTPVVEALTSSGFNVYAYDQRGHGRSPGERALLRLEDFTADHLAAREWLRHHLPELPTFALGHSMGGLVTIRSALRDPRGLAGVVLSSPALLLAQQPPAWRRVASAALARVAPNLPVGDVAQGVLSRNPEVDAVFQSDPLCYNGKVKALTGHAFLTSAARVWGELPRWRLPTLVIHGVADALIAVEGSRRFVQGIASEDKELWEVEGGYHELFNDLGSDEALGKVTGWLQQHVATP